MRLVIDTNVIVAALRSPTGASAKLLRAVRQGSVRLLANPALFFEYEAVLKRPENLSASGLTVSKVDVFLTTLSALVTPVPGGAFWRPLLSDPDDEFVLQAAINGAADALVTFEIRTFLDAARRFRIDVQTPGAVCARLLK